MPQRSLAPPPPPSVPPSLQDITNAMSYISQLSLSVSHPALQGQATPSDVTEVEVYKHRLIDAHTAGENDVMPAWASALLEGWATKMDDMEARLHRDAVERQEFLVHDDSERGQRIVTELHGIFTNRFNDLETCLDKSFSTIEKHLIRVEIATAAHNLSCGDGLRRPFALLPSEEGHLPNDIDFVIPSQNLPLLHDTRAIEGLSDDQLNAYHTAYKLSGNWRTGNRADKLLLLQYHVGCSANYSM
ncbi:uncharacterized protein EV420DRAFT_1642360 [Desarmillaria tabescens]|uniref:Mug135-like C-terminal domain-containing protein n=1 Tax=Armillaria tabescens TaxID=1929756 RepID=A0AA39KEN5_ARMTA|nr:uncharacterized protein EV420DRAFT_1642360 [Desarmillaria tabescens]KAK0459383.1 hypothetical protein EV420DRAFT_1642360 [Desarmillaria tabescens]